MSNNLADLGQKVLIIDSDMRKPSVHKFFKVDNVIGLSNLITDRKNNPKKSYSKNKKP